MHIKNIELIRAHRMMVFLSCLLNPAAIKKILGDFLSFLQILRRRLIFHVQHEYKKKLTLFYNFLFSGPVILLNPAKKKRIFVLFCAG